MVSIKTISILTIIICLVQLAAYSILFALNEFSFSDLDVLSYMKIITWTDNKYFYTIVVSFALNGVWFITSICLAHFASKGISQYLKIIGIIWIVFAIFNCICDVVFIGLFANDIITITTMPAAMKTAIISMMVICARGIILLILNFCTTIVMLISITRLSNDLQNGLKTRTVPLKPPKSVLKQTKETHLEEENVPRVKDWYNHYEQPEGKDDNEPPPATDIIRRFIPRIRNFRGNDPLPFNKTQNNNQNSHTTGIPGSNTNVMINGVPSGTLRRQLPWSYMPNLNKPRAPPVPPPKPHVPAPDYNNLRQPQPQTRRDLQEQNWSQYM